MFRSFVAIAVFALVAGSTARAEAQNRRDRDRGIVMVGESGVRGGFFITGGIGAGGEQFKFADEPSYSEKLTKPTLTLRLGGTPDDYIRLGGEIFAWHADQGDVNETFSTVLGVIQFFPIKDAGLWFKGGAGIAVSAVDNVDPLFFDISETGFGWSVGVGYDAQLSKSVGIGPAVELYQGSFTRRDEPTLTERVLNIGVQLTFQTGGRRR